MQVGDSTRAKHVWDQMFGSAILSEMDSSASGFRMWKVMLAYIECMEYWNDGVSMMGSVHCENEDLE